jgi:hypothetical protein
MEHLLNTVLDALPQIFGDLVPVCVSVTTRKAISQTEFNSVLE